MMYTFYLDKFNAWLETNTISGTAQLMYFKMLHMFNTAGWEECINVNDIRLMVMADTTCKETAIGALGELLRAGLIECVGSLAQDSGGGTVRGYRIKKWREEGRKYKAVNHRQEAMVDLAGDRPLIKPGSSVGYYLDRVNPAASQRSLEEIAGFERRMGAEVCIRSMEIALDSRKATWPYIRAILQRWQNDGVKTLDDVRRMEQKKDKEREQEKRAERFRRGRYSLRDYEYDGGDSL